MVNNTRNKRFVFLSFILSLPQLALAQSAQTKATLPLESTAPYSGHLLQTTLALLLVLALLLGLAWSLKKMGFTPKGQRQQFYKFIAVQHLGPKEKIALVEIGDTWLVLGITPHSINTLHSMPKDSLDLHTNNTNPAVTFAKLLERIKSPQVKS
ncbi:MAG TPA: flagellar biosynthetic protein FliO [Limnobacter sp.]|uniref:flagellar biosynthetic protein FliO n=1 Tax=Limnobacter sp. TaxID=2003368 RepID=UPI002E375A6B|nr:flagellar biosynthetic protein FliO [Limnobacter sp.]HEX5487180.1 flagellar biosynthetic protein FliO [Limnobacter sp.]